ncbi:NAD(P)-dependent malic enzyme [Kosmotoga pacifica]|uniref:Malate dehydrogenase n=1 Tax=Kosmotoga pacifica TaxID=1330330 RepID=A0A0G2ZCX3_9BACT|nr:NADP-dependent malic enzyme [Kosmotoga pacifica]AKI97419.1 malate dehydrogenase [Kosmotoga pacifica]
MNNEALELHKKFRGKLEVKSRIPVNNQKMLSLAYTPGVADVSKLIHEKPEEVFTYTNRWNAVAIVSDGSAVLGLGNIGPEAALPVMEGKAVLFKEFANVDAYPLCINTQDPEKIVEFVETISPTFGGINLEDIASPQCFYIETELRKRLNIPVFHDDQHGAAIIILAALKNALKIIGKRLNEIKVATVGVGAAGGAVIKMLLAAGVRNIVACDRNGILNKNHPETLLNPFHEEIASLINPEGLTGSLEDAMKGADVFIGTSVGGLVTQDMVRSMAKDPVIFAVANPIPEIYPDEAKEAGAKIVATGRSDFDNQINNVLVFPGLFRGALSVRAKDINDEMKLAAVDALAGFLDESEVCESRIIPRAFDPGVGKAVAMAVAKAAIDSGVAKVSPESKELEQIIDGDISLPR